MTNFDHPPKILFLYGSLRERSYSRLLAEEAARIIESMGAEVKFFHPHELPLRGQVSETHPADDYDAVISMCGCGVNLPPEWVTQSVFEDWELEDPDGKSIKTFHRVRDEIKEKVAQLVERLS
jgi:protein-tyrosine-phosphatase